MSDTPRPLTQAQSRNMKRRMALRTALVEWRAARDHYRAYSRLLHERRADPLGHLDTIAILERLVIDHGKAADDRWAACFFAIRRVEETIKRPPSRFEAYPQPVSVDDWRLVFGAELGRAAP